MLNKLHFKSLLLMLCMLLGANAWAGEVTDVIDKTATSELMGTTGSTTWKDITVTGTSGAEYAIHSMGLVDDYGIRWNKNGYMYATKSGGKVKSVTIVGDSKSVDIYASNSAYTAKATATKLGSLTASSTGATYTFVDDYDYIAINGTTSSTQITSITIVWTTSDVTLNPNDLTLSVSSLTLDLGATTPTTQLTNSGQADGAITWSSSNTNVATVDAQGNVTAVEVGTCTITATQAASSTYYGGSAECVVTVTDSRYLLASLVFTAKCNGVGTDTGNFGWLITSDGAETNFEADYGIHYGANNNNNVQYLQLSCTSNNGTIKKVVVNARDAQACATVSVTVGNVAFTCATGTTATNLSSDFVFTGDAKGAIVVRIDRGSSKAKAIYVKKVDVYYEESTLLNPELSFESTGPFVVATDGDILPPTLNNPHNLDVFYNSDDETVAYVDYDDGSVSIEGPGWATITATSLATDTYDAGSASYTIRVVEVEDGVFDFTTGYDYDSSMEHGSVAENSYNWQAGDVILYLNGRNCWYTDNTLRLYTESTSNGVTIPAGTMTFEVPTGKAITEIAFTGNSGKLQGLDVDSGSYTVDGTTATWTGMAESVMFTDTANVVIKTITVTYVDATGVLSPTFSIASGLYTSEQSVEISCATDGATIYYTTDSTDPTDESTEYTTALSIYETTTIKAIAYKDGDASAVSTITLTFRKAANIAELKAYEDKTEDIILTLNNAQIYYVNNKDMYIGDASGAVDMYNLGLTYTAGQILNGTAIVKFEVYRNTPEVTSFTPVGELTVSNGTATPIEMSGSAVTLEDNVCQLVKVTGPYTSDGTSTYIDALLCYNKFGIEEPAYDTSKLYAATGIVVPYNGSPELALISVEEAPVAVEGDVDGDGTPDNDDLSYLVRFLLGKETEEKGCDVDGNGTVSLSDITALVNILTK